MSTTTLNAILERVASYHPSPNLELIRQAHAFAAQAHEGQLRKSGEPYFTHPLEVAGLIAELKLDDASICAGLLHDVVEDTLISLPELEQRFGKEIAALVDGVTKLSQVEFTSKEEAQAENFRKMLLAMNRDIRVILVKLADRLHNMRTLQFQKQASQQRIARETMEIYAPLANRLGIFWLKAEIEDLSFKFLYPEVYAELTQKVSKKKKERERHIDEVCRIIDRKLKENGIEAEVKGRPKHFWSIFQKMRKKGIDFEEVYDRVAFRILVDKVGTCYEVLGLLHSLWSPVQGRFKDYIAVPKPNSYQSLHTTVIGPAGEFIEIQIRTREMHDIAEHGISAHWRYKEGGKGVSPRDEKKFTWLRGLVEAQKYLDDPTVFIESMKVDLFSDEAFIYTPDGDVKVLAAGSTPVDFAYAIHTQVGHRCVGAKVNGVMVPLRHVLKNGDVVEILTSPKQHPSKDWLEFVQTSRARTKIRSYIHREQQLRSQEIGRELLEKELRRYQLSYAKLLKNGELERVASECKSGTVDELLIALGYGKVPLDKVIEHLRPPAPKEEPAPVEADESTFARFMKKLSRTSQSGICIQGMDDILVRFARCCNPVPGDEIVGFITRGRGITVHQRSCRQVVGLDPERGIDVYWDKVAPQLRAVDVRVITSDAPGMLAELSKRFTDNGVNIQRANCRVLENRKTINSFEVLVKDKVQLLRILRSLEKIDGVISVERVTTA
ncbi:MAG: bifunctional (p)ppGpp synthetase/guanosine-3',5'-bis(diphosphate) 3'-pyrophosphohydrolase [Myxococcota bacterium]|jgi:GTP pyrophosphokinase|nr:bifunctional (p)ppGpp synthetase/guanosine-3',5'-bis(diphosphate) 3'-pyrophosphohydrolase [Myxococcota bacterium]